MIMFCVFIVFVCCDTCKWMLCKQIIWSISSTFTQISFWSHSPCFCDCSLCEIFLSWRQMASKRTSKDSCSMDGKVTNDWQWHDWLGCFYTLHHCKVFKTKSSGNGHKPQNTSPSKIQLKWCHRKQVLFLLEKKALNYLSLSIRRYKKNCHENLQSSLTLCAS